MVYFSLKKISLALLILGLLAGGGIWFFGHSQNPPLRYSNTPANERLQDALDSEDWQVVLENLKKPEGNSALESEKETEENIREANEDILTTDLANSFIEPYLRQKLQNPSLPLDQESKKAIIEDSLKGLAESFTKAINPYSKESLTILESQGSEEKRAYLNQVGQILKIAFPFDSSKNKYLPSQTAQARPAELPEDVIFVSAKNLTPELAVVFGAIYENQPERLSNLTEFIEAYGKASGKLLGLAVPGDYLDFHLKLVNSFSNTAYALESLQQIAQDPAKGIFGLQLYTAELIRSPLILKDLKNLLAKDDLVFGSEEAASLFYQYLKNI